MGQSLLEDGRKPGIEDVGAGNGGFQIFRVS